MGEMKVMMIEMMIKNKMWTMEVMMEKMEIVKVKIIKMLMKENIK